MSHAEKLREAIRLHALAVTPVDRLATCAARRAERIVKAKPAPLRYDAPCAGCGGPHGVAACATEAAAKLLEADGKVMTAHEVRRRGGVR